MYPNLYYVFKDWFGVEWNALKILNTFGLMVAIAFVVAAIVLSSELKRKEKLGLLLPREEQIIVGKPASMLELMLNGLIGFVFGYKLIGLLFSKPAEVNAQDYIFSKEGNIIGGILIAAILIGIKWWERNKQKLKEPEHRSVRIWPHDRVGDIIILGLVFGILGAKLFDNFENWDEFIKDPIGRIFSQSGLTFYGGLILAAVAICWYAVKKGIKIRHLVDAAAPALILAYAIGRIGCQVAGDGDWGIYNSAYVSDAYGKVTVAPPGEFDKKLQTYADYFTRGEVTDSANHSLYITDRFYGTLDKVPHKYFKGPSFLPNWFFAYPYPQNVNTDGILIPGINDEHNRVLPLPVFPTPMYETIICTLIFLFLWSIRKKIKTPLVMFGIYLILNGIERFCVELIRVNKTYQVFGLHPSQAEIIAILLIISGLACIFIGKFRFSSLKK
ncbi:MAG: prolipoprotein diacylglyceryl transferase [Bacteroidetes bacterium]|nr:prolipoprotein diacylglyceryl transferase [Bacteroidota bacterium]MBS1757499.1 prolipoprotein diacylglyceryl transferase [Bacteroidota bacterium]